MVSVSNVTPRPATAPGDTANPAARTPQKVLGQDDFLKLLAVQFQAQDPMKPMEDTAFIAQMAQFSSLQTATATQQTIEKMNADQQRVIANSYLGQRVTVDNGDGTMSTGEVSGVETTDDTPRLVIGDATFPVSSVLLVEPNVVSAPAPQPVDSGGA